MVFKRTVIGSFPSALSKFSIDAAVKRVVDLQLKYGVEVITDGEQRGSLIDYFKQIPGLGKKAGRPAILGKIKPMEDPKMFYKIVDCKRVFSYLSDIGRDDVKVKITITGPITLGFTYAVSGAKPYSGFLDRELYLDLVDALLPIIEEAVKMGCYVQIDEPGLSGKFVSPKFAEAVLKELFAGIHSHNEVTIHVCGPIGSVPDLYEMLLRLDLDVLSFAFSGEKERENLQLISERSLEDYGKRLGAGFISNVKAEPADIAFNRLKKIAERAGIENIAFVHPDCGFRKTPMEVVQRILAAMKQAADDFLRSLE